MKKTIYRTERCLWILPAGVLHLPAEIDRDKVEAKFEDGILRINIVKVTAENKQIREISRSK
jgi:HSP20 family molecular chaperone IbpA